MHSKLLVVISSVVLILGTAACSDDESTDPPTPEEEAEQIAAADAGPCTVETALTISGSTVADGALDVISEFADVTLDETADLVFASYSIDEDPQSGLSAPVGDPGAPSGGVIFQFSLFAGVDKTLGTGTYASNDEAEPRITTISLYAGSERINPLGDHTVTITEYTDDAVCGEIAAVGETALQSFPTVTGRFNVPRV
jgi:hypothetical protein